MTDKPANIQSQTMFLGFDGLRLFAAVAVIFSHSYLLASGDGGILAHLFRRIEILGIYGVFAFFVMSGFLLARSLAHNGNALQFAANRIVRIFPGFITCMLFTGFVAGPLGTSLSLSAYFQDSLFHKFLLGALKDMADLSLPGVFAYDGRLNYATNGSLWSLRYEVLSYLLLLVTWVLFRNIRRTIWAILFLAVLTTITSMNEKQLGLPFGILPGVAYTLTFFAGGLLMYLVYERWGVRTRWALMSAVALGVSGYFDMAYLTFAFFGAYLVVFIGDRATALSLITKRIGDISYGVYLYGWPVQQLVEMWTHVSDPLVLTALSIPPSLLLGYLSSRFVEQPAMKRRHMLAGRALSAVRSLQTRLQISQISLDRGARIAFVMAATCVLVSEKLWWFTVESLLYIGVATTLGSIVIGYARRTSA